MSRLERSRVDLAILNARPVLGIMLNRILKIYVVVNHLSLCISIMLYYFPAGY